MATTTTAGEALLTGDDVPVARDLTKLSEAEHTTKWVNSLVGQLWPYVNLAIQDYAKTSLMPRLVEELGSVVEQLQCEKLDLGDKAIELDGVTVHPFRSESEQVVIDADISYVGDLVVSATFATVPFGVADVKFSGRIRLLIGPLIPKFPIIGGLTLFFLKLPTFGYTLSGEAQKLDQLKPQINSALNGLLQANIVLPNRFVTTLDPSVDVSLLKYPNPIGALFVTLLSVSGLEDKDIGRNNKSDVVVKATVGNFQFKTQTFQNERVLPLNVRFDIPLDEKEDAFLKLQVLDEDVREGGASTYENLGSTSINISHIDASEQLELVLDDSKSGKLAVRLDPFDLLPSVPLDMPSNVFADATYQVNVRFGDFSGNALEKLRAAAGRLALNNKEWPLSISHNAASDETTSATLSGNGRFLIFTAEPKVDYYVQIYNIATGESVGYAQGQVEFNTSAVGEIAPRNEILPLGDELELNAKFSLFILSPLRSAS